MQHAIHLYQVDQIYTRYIKYMDNVGQGVQAKSQQGIKFMCNSGYKVQVIVYSSAQLH